MILFRKSALSAQSAVDLMTSAERAERVAAIYIITFYVADRAKVLDNEETFRAFKSAVSKLRGWSVTGAILMPDHVHLLAAPDENREVKVGKLVGALKRGIRQALNAPWKWKPGSSERLLGREESVHEKRVYLEENPVRAGLVSRSQDWPYRIGFDKGATEQAERVAEIPGDALESGPEEQPALIPDPCRSDAEMRAEVESLLESQEKARDFIEAPVDELAAPSIVDVVSELRTGQTLGACKDTFSYRASKFVVRNKVAVSAAAIVLLTIIGGLIVALWQGENARRERDLAQREKVKAERVNEFTQRMLSFSNQSISSVSALPQKKDVTVNQMLDRITPHIEAELADQPDVRAQVLRTIGSTYMAQGEYDAAEKNLRAALETQTRLYGEENPEVAATMFELGLLSYREVKLEEAARLLEKTIAFYQKQRQLNTADYSAAKLALALDALGVVKAYSGEAKAAKSLLTEAMQIASAANLKGNERNVLIGVRVELGGLLIRSGELERGETLLRQSVDEFRQVSGPPRWELGVALILLAECSIAKKQFDEALPFLQESEQIYRQTLGDKNGYLAYNLEQQAVILFQKNDLKFAEEKARQSLAMAQDVFPGNKVPWTSSLAILGRILNQDGRAPEAEDYLRQTLSINEQAAAKNFGTIATIKIFLSQSLFSQNRLAEAERIALEAHEQVRQHLGETSPLLKDTASNLKKIYEQEGKYDLAESLEKTVLP